MSETVEFYGQLKRETDDAYLVNDGIEDIWIPKSQVESARLISGEDWEFEIPLWLAEKEGIV